MLDTKAKRTQVRENEFNRLIGAGWQKVEYKTVVILYTEKDLLIKTYWGTAATHEEYKRYRTLPELMLKIEAVKSSADRREQYKNERKKANAGKLSNQAAAAAAIRTELKKAYPNCKFSVTSESFAGGDSVYISWTDGPTRDKVEAITSKYQYGSFNGMEDIYEYTNSREDLPQSKYVSESRSLSETLVNEIAEQLKAVRVYTEAQLNGSDYRNNPTQDATQLLYSTDIPKDYLSAKVIREPDAHEFQIQFTTATQPEPTQPTTTANDQKIQVVDYTEKSFAIIGNFSEIYSDLIAMGGKYNKFLKCGRGIIFSKTKLDEVKAFLIANKEPKPLETPAQPTTLKDEIKETVNFFAKTDLMLYGEVSESTKQAAAMQQIEICRFPKLPAAHPLNILDPESNQYKEALIEYQNA